MFALKILTNNTLGNVATATRALAHTITKISAIHTSTVVNNAEPAAVGSRGLVLTFSSPNMSFYKDEVVKQVDVPTYSGCLGILDKHVPILAVIKPGVVNVFKSDGTSHKVFVSAGTVTMNEDSTLLILASEAADVEDLDLQEAQKNLATALADNSPEAKIQAEVNQAIIEAAK